MREMVLGQDASFTMESFIKRYNSDLANDLGNLVGRITTLIERHFAGCIPQGVGLEQAEKDLIKSSDELHDVVSKNISLMKLSEAVEEIMQFVRSINRYMERSEPWKLAKNNIDKAGTVLFVATYSLANVLNLLHPIMPVRIEKILKMIGLDMAKGLKQVKPGQLIGEFEIPFPRIELEKNNSEIEKEQTMSDSKIEINDFAKLDLRTAIVKSAEKVEGADKLLKLKLELGDEMRQIVAGIAEHYSVEDIIGKTIIIVANMKPAVIRGVESNGMLLAASTDESVTVLTIENPEIGSGIRVS
jgi:methionyl-tRNA synthetase